MPATAPISQIWCRCQTATAISLRRHPYLYICSATAQRFFPKPLSDAPAQKHAGLRRGQGLGAGFKGAMRFHAYSWAHLAATISFAGKPTGMDDLRGIVKGTYWRRAMHPLKPQTYFHMLRRDKGRRTMACQSNRPPPALFGWASTNSSSVESAAFSLASQQINQMR